MAYDSEKPFPPAYGSQSPQTANQMFSPSPVHASTPPAEISHAHTGEFRGQSPMQQVQQYPPPQQQFTQYPQQGGYPQQQGQFNQQGQFPPQQPQQVHNHFPQQHFQPQQQSMVGNDNGFKSVVPLGALSANPAPVECPSCQQRAMTTITFVAGNTTHGWAIALCCIILLPCIPYLVSSMKDVQHRCSKCGALLATWHRSGRVEVHMYA